MYMELFTRAIEITVRECCLRNGCVTATMQATLAVVRFVLPKDKLMCNNMLRICGAGMRLQEWDHEVVRGVAPTMVLVAEVMKDSGYLSGLIHGKGTRVDVTTLTAYLAKGHRWREGWHVQ